MKFTVISRREQAVIVEWQDALGPHRSILPASAVDGRELSYDQLAEGIPYGVAWETLDLGGNLPAAIARALREHGIWTREDLSRHLPLARSALQAVHADEITRLIDGARRAELKEVNYE